MTSSHDSIHIWALSPNPPPLLSCPHQPLLSPSRLSLDGGKILSCLKQSVIQSYVTNRCQLLLQGMGGGGKENSLIRQDIAVTSPLSIRQLHLVECLWISLLFLITHPTQTGAMSAIQLCAQLNTTAGAQLQIVFSLPLLYEFVWMSTCVFFFFKQNYSF